MICLLLTLFVMIKAKKKKTLQKYIKGPLASCADLTKEKWNWVAKTNKKPPTTPCEQVKMSKTITQNVPV